MVSFDLIGDSIERNRKVISHHKTKQKRESNTHKNAEERLGETKKLFSCTGDMRGACCFLLARDERCFRVFIR